MVTVVSFVGTVSATPQWRSALPGNNQKTIPDIPGASTKWMISPTIPASVRN
jgi:hypothetical protein